MKTKLKYILYSLMFLSLHLTIYGCNDNPLTNTNGKTYKAVTERNFQDKNFKAEPGAVIVLNLEDKNSPPDTGWYDTDVIGIDIIPIKYTETAKHHFKIDKDSDFEMSLISDSSKQVLFELTPQNTQADIMIPAGDYLMIITSLEDFKPDSLRSQMVFIQPDTEILSSANTDYDYAQLNTLISTKRCPGCNLSNASLAYARLAYANLDSADLRNADLHNADLGYAKLEYADLSNANLNNVSLINVYLSNAKLEGAKLINVNLTYADLRNAYLPSAKLKDADLTYANLINSNLSRVDLSNAKLIEANLDTADLRGADLSYADLRSANFCGAIKTGIISTGVITNAYTQCWP